MNVEQHKTYMNACNGAPDAYHDQLVQEAAAELKGRMNDVEIEQAIAAMRCPVCGCGLVGGTPSTPRGD
jgi:hypothetical protein